MSPAGPTRFCFKFLLSGGYDAAQVQRCQQARGGDAPEADASGGGAPGAPGASEGATAPQNRRHARSLSGAIGNFTNSLASKFKRDSGGSSEPLATLAQSRQAAGETMPHAHHHHHHHGQRLTGRRGFDHAHPRRGLLGGRRSPHGFSTKNIRTQLRSQEAYPDEEGGERAKEKKEREFHKMRLIWNEFERLKIKFHELVHNNNASFESISSQSDPGQRPPGTGWGVVEAMAIPATAMLAMTPQKVESPPTQFLIRRALVLACFSNSTIGQPIKPNNLRYLVTQVAVACFCLFLWDRYGR